ncbi:MAG: efflux RND transporter permease subunit [Tidjanibacter sp.]|nr:efflux RND transporter permease subunit [Tidjanibacter sp.]
MLNKIIRFSLDNRLMVTVVSLIIAAAGILFTARMEVDVFPDLTAPTVVVMTEAGGMATEEVEKLVTFPIETALNGATDVRRVRSQSSMGFSVVWVEFDWGTNIYTARQIVSERLATVGENLPPSVGQPVLGPQSSIMGEIYIIGLTSGEQTSMQDLRTLADWTIRPRLLSLGGVAQVSVIGGEEKEYQIVASPRKMMTYNVSLHEILEASRGMNLNTSGGSLYRYGNEFLIRGKVATTNVDEIARGVVKMAPDGTPITIGDVADVRIGNHEPKIGTASVETEPSVLITVTKQPNTNTLELTKLLDSTIADLSHTLPEDIRVKTDIFRQARFIENSIQNVSKALLEGAIFVIIILFIFLMNARVTAVSLVALPLSLLVAIVVLKLFGLTINTMSLGGMAIAIGSLVDDAIIDVENVYKRLRENHALPKEERKPTLEVVFEGSKEIRSSIVSATLITIIAFTPLFFLSGMEGRMLRPLGISFIVSLFASLVVAMTLTPVMCSTMLTSERALKKGDKESPVALWLKRIYKRALEWAMHHKRAVIYTMVGLFAGALVLFTTFGSSFLPPFNEGSLTINTSLMPGVSLEESDKAGRMVEEILLTIPEIETVARKTGRAHLDEHALGVNACELEAPFTLTDRSRDEFLADVRARLGELKGVNVEIGQPISHRIDAMLSGTKANIAIKLFGEDLNLMFQLAEQIKNEISDTEGITDLVVEQQIERSELHITPRRDMLARHGITLPEFAEFVEASLSGDHVDKVYEGNRSFDLTVKVDGNDKASTEDIGNLLIRGMNGTWVPLAEVADISSTSGPNSVSRENVKRKVVVSANVVGGDLGGAVESIREQIEENIALPEDYYVEYGGQFESQQNASRVLMLASLAALIIIFILLVQEFRKVRLAGMVLLNLPLAMIGGVASIGLTSGVVSIPSIIGFISLLGIAVRNGILLVSHYEQLRKDGMDLYDSVIRGSLDRLNPILMTSLTSALALIPLAMGGDVPGNEIQSPMAQVILGGLISSTLLNGFVIPAMYLLLNRKEESKLCEE